MAQEATSTGKSLAIIVMSTRKPRIGPQVAALVKDAIAPLAAAASINVSTIDLADFNLPVYDEEAIPSFVPAQHTFKHAHSIAWSKAISAPDAYLLVIPEYNYGMAGSTKNAIDYLYHEWKGKPAGVISYGIAGGSTASEQVTRSLEGVGLKVAATKPTLGFARGLTGRDVFPAMQEGKLGEDSIKLWTEDEEYKGLYAKVFAEVKELLEKPAEAEKA